MTPRTLDELLFHWGAVIARSEGWEKSFALTIQKSRYRKGWQPSAKQLKLMRRMVEALFDQDAELIEREDHG